MDNEVVIHVRSDNDTKPGFDSARREANMTAADIEGTFKKQGPKIGDKLAGGIKGGVGSGFSSSMPLVAQFGIGASPIIGAAASAGIIGGAGIGGVIGGLLLVKDDPRVKAAGTALGTNLLSSLKNDARPMVEPFLGAIAKVGDAFDTKLRPRIANIFANSSQFIAPLTDGLIGAVDGISRGFDSLVQKAGPVINSIGHLFSDVGDAVGDALDTISGGSEDAAKFVNDLSDAISGTIRVVGYLVRGLTEVYGAIHDSAEATGLWIHDLTHADEEAGSFAKHVATVDGALSGMADATDESTNALKDLSDEMLAQTDPLFALIDAQRDVTEAQGEYNKAVRDSGRKSAEAKEALENLGQAAFRMNGKVGDAAGGFNGRFTPAMRTALSNAKLTQGQINRLEGQLRSAASAANKWEGTFTQTFITRRIITGPGGQKLSAGGGGRQGAQASGGISTAASGHIGDGMTWVGENGPELLDLPPGAQVHSNPDSQRMAAGQTGGGAGSDQPIVINLMVDDHTIATAILPPLQKLNRSDYSGDVTRMFPATR